METSWTLPVPKHKFSDLYLCFCGYEACQPFHSYGPAVRPNYVIHYIISGKGTFTIGNRTYRLTAGQGFFLMPNVRTYYEADADDPWTYLWIGFDGEKAASYVQELGLSEEHPVYQCNFSGELQSLLFQMQKHNTYDTSDQYLLEGCLYQFFSILSREITLADPSARRSAIFTWKKPLSLSEIIIPMKFLSRILPDMYASTGVTFIPCFRNISIPHRRTIFLPAGSRVRSSFYRIRISPSKRSLFPVVTGMPKFLPKPSARSRA